MNTKKMVSTAKFMNTIARVGGGIFGVCAIICLVFAVLAAILGEGILEMGTFTVELGHVTLYLADEFPRNMEMMRWYACVGLLGISVVCILIWRASIHLRAILTPMEEGRPFEPGTSGSLRKLAWLTLIGGLLSQILGIAERVILMGVCSMEALFAPEAVARVEYTFKIAPGFLWAACLILFLSYIFSYGQALQQEADETL